MYTYIYLVWHRCASPALCRHYFLLTFVVFRHKILVALTLLLLALFPVGVPLAPDITSLALPCAAAACLPDACRRIFACFRKYRQVSAVCLRAAPV